MQGNNKEQNLTNEQVKEFMEKNGIGLDKDSVFDEYVEENIKLYKENIMLKAYIKKLEKIMVENHMKTLKSQEGEK
jgi:hypothetical protein